MNSKRKALISVLVLVSIGMMLYPPFHIVIRSTEINMGYGFLFAPPARGSIIASVHVAVLVAQWVVIVLVAVAGWFLVNDDEVTRSKEIIHEVLDKKSLVESPSFTHLPQSSSVSGKSEKIKKLFRWSVFSVACILALAIYAIWKEYDQSHGGGVLSAAIRGALIFGGIAFLWSWAKSSGEQPKNEKILAVKENQPPTN